MHFVKYYSTEGCICSKTLLSLDISCDFKSMKHNAYCVNKTWKVGFYWSNFKVSEICILQTHGPHARHIKVKRLCKKGFHCEKTLNKKGNGGGGGLDIKPFHFSEWLKLLSFPLFHLAQFLSDSAILLHPCLNWTVFHIRSYEFIRLGLELISYW